MPYSEWFACSTLEPLHVLVRTLFTVSRHKGKSVWHACVREGSPAFWFTGTHKEGEHFVDQAAAPASPLAVVVAPALAWTGRIRVAAAAALAFTLILSSL